MKSVAGEVNPQCAVGCPINEVNGEKKLVRLK
jgi:hypothetical protein